MHRLAVAAVLIAIAPATVVIDNPRVRVFRTSDGSLAGVDHGPGVVISLDSGTAEWMDDVASQSKTTVGRSLIVVQPRRTQTSPEPTPPAAAPGSAPGEAAFKGMSFNPLFENDQVRVIRARMEVGASEAFHTHGSDTLVVHLTGGAIEDTANGKTTVNRWKRGDVELETRGSSHSARNVGKAVDVILVALEP
jgi:quercetin dioxygenase-like cupin family protein